jgi:hypothetical protein
MHRLSAYNKPIFCPNDVPDVDYQRGILGLYTPPAALVLAVTPVLIVVAIKDLLKPSTAHTSANSIFASQHRPRRLKDVSERKSIIDHQSS